MQYEKVHNEKSATWKVCNTKKVQHGKSETQKECNKKKKKMEHENSAKMNEV